MKIKRIKKHRDVLEVETYCCSSMKDRLQDGSSLLFRLGENGISMYDQWSSCSTWSNPDLQIKFCPFCGEKIEIGE